MPPDASPVVGISAFRIALAGWAMNSGMGIASMCDGFADRDWRTATDGIIRLALVGLGWWTVDVAIPAIDQAELCETTVLVSSTREKALEKASAHDIAHGISYEEFHDGAKRDEYDAVYVGTPNALHLEYVQTAVELGKAVLCEKPIEATEERATTLVETAEAAGIALMCAYRMQTDPAVRRAREWIEDGLIGEPAFVYGNNSQPVLKMIPDPDQWRLDPDLAGYGTSVMDLGIYTINTTRFLLGRDPVRASAEMISEHDAFSEVPDQHAAFMLVLDGEIPLVSTTSQHAQRDTQLKITGTEGQLELAPAFHGEVRLILARGDVHAEIEHTGFDATAEMREEFDYFADRVLTGAPIDPDGRHALVDMATIRAIHEAANSGETVEI